jgi:exonuclease SbcD
MRILHTSDWHLGKLLREVSLIEDQRHVLRQLVAMVETEKPDAVVVAGDIYDRAVPPVEAVELLDWVLTELVARLGTPTLLIAGNHDSPDRLRFGSTLLRRHGLHVVGRWDGDLAPIPVGKDGGVLCPVPFVEPAAAREALGDEGIATHEDALRAITARFRAKIPAGVPSVLVAHAYVAGGHPSDSERLLNIGGAEQVGGDCFAGFGYTALGHLHRPQDLGPRLRYSGSLLKLSRSEAKVDKSVSLVDLRADGLPTVRALPLIPRHDVRIVEGRMEDLEAGIPVTGDPEDYLYVDLLDTALPVNAMNRLRARFPNLVALDVSTALAARPGAPVGEPLRQLDDLSLFDAFLRRYADRSLEPEERAVLAEVIKAAGEGRP